MTGWRACLAKALGDGTDRLAPVLAILALALLAGLTDAMPLTLVALIAISARQPAPHAGERSRHAQNGPVMQSCGRSGFAVSEIAPSRIGPWLPLAVLLVLGAALSGPIISSGPIAAMLGCLALALHPGRSLRGPAMGGGLFVLPLLLVVATPAAGALTTIGPTALVVLLMAIALWTIGSASIAAS